MAEQFPKAPTDFFFFFKRGEHLNSPVEIPKPYKQKSLSVVNLYSHFSSIFPPKVPFLIVQFIRNSKSAMDL